MQKLLAAPGGLKSYLASPDMLLHVEGARTCPFCPDRHDLRLHGHYHRYLVDDGGGQAGRIPVRRLLCTRTGRTVSLLPCFCLPRRQHGTELLAGFLDRYSRGQSLRSALLGVRPDATGHSTAQSLRAGFLARNGPIRAYLATCRARALEFSPSATPGPRREVATLMAALCQGFSAAVGAFIWHAVGLHAMQQIGLA